LMLHQCMTAVLWLVRRVGLHPGGRLVASSTCVTHAARWARFEAMAIGARFCAAAEAQALSLAS